MRITWKCYYFSLPPVSKMYYIDAFQMVAVVTVGFVKDAKDHVDVQGFNVYHKNRLIKVACQSLLYGQLQNQT